MPKKHPEWRSRILRIVIIIREDSLNLEKLTVCSRYFTPESLIENTGTRTHFSRFCYIFCHKMKSEAHKKARKKRMAATVILKNRHSLQGLNLTNLIKNIRDGKPLSVEEMASFQEGKSLADLSIQELTTAFSDNLLSEETLEDVLKKSGRPVNLYNCRRAIHEAICFANEFGQPASGSKDGDQTDYQPPMTRSPTTRKVEEHEQSTTDSVKKSQLSFNFLPNSSIYRDKHIIDFNCGSEF
ncbi:hypothetical protein LOTGIDRAFT_175545 [Lottia gigantea]|uniref:Uncharacterized protein n=1 Tax=Lottia gigantea TaxID=225164 RepID=V4A9Q1_LOTGI|nr:hypothetical protein LOTGIDRAFT_175545 [Lottia gigantea]ESO93467.1 hypothetical protein LOTGIDRAFT_175545 [Lottia gigantea]